MLRLVLVCAVCAFVIASPADRQKRADFNPCTPQALAVNQTYFALPDDRTGFIECDLLGHANVMPCPPGLVWDETRLSCVYDFTTQTGSGSGSGSGSGDGSGATVKPTEMSLAAMKALCSPENIAAAKLFFPHPDHNKFIQCDLWGDVYVVSCPSKLTWNAVVSACDSEFHPDTIGK